MNNPPVRLTNLTGKNLWHNQARDFAAESKISPGPDQLISRTTRGTTITQRRKRGGGGTATPVVARWA